MARQPTPQASVELHSQGLPGEAVQEGRATAQQHCWCMQVPAAYIERLDLVPDVDKAQLSILVHGNAAARGLKVSLLYGPTLLKFQLLEAIIVDLSAVIAILLLVLLDLDKDTAYRTFASACICIHRVVSATRSYSWFRT